MAALLVLSTQGTPRFVSQLKGVDAAFIGIKATQRHLFLV
ncbi:hypothetical protein SFHH103_00248 [Sinorhizobium fredii HH103]|uniref:Uncharacterized protein n=1 Tax=Sinorhizobium fredii (strain HH103) TaxID=1117943 RepID=G9AAX2_SINF1|nr:hypothetical protein SFHH103_00248 [Sinorhizobium fredii HH103]